jgi:hypothetical protein
MRRTARGDRRPGDCGSFIRIPNQQHNFHNSGKIVSEEPHPQTASISVKASIIPPWLPWRESELARPTLHWYQRAKGHSFVHPGEGVLDMSQKERVAASLEQITSLCF